MACIYTDSNGVTYTSPKELIKEFYLTNYELRNASIFSKSQIQESIYNKILKIPDIKAFKESELNIYRNEKGNLIDKIPVTEFIVRSDATLFSKLQGEKPRERLNAEYIVENRIIEFVKKKLNSNEIPNIDNFGEYTQKYLEILKQAFSNVDENILKYHLSSIEQEIVMENKTKVFGTFLHELVSLKISDSPNYLSTLNKFVRSSSNDELFGENKEKWILKINEIVESIKEQVTKFGIPITEIFLVSDNQALAQVRGKIDLIAVDTNGDSHIFEIKISKHNYSDWDSAKLRNLDWQLSLYKQLLGQHINVDRTQLYVIPIEMSVLGDPSRIYLGTIKNRKVENSIELSDLGNITRISNKLIPRKVTPTYDPDRENALKKELVQLLPDYEIKADFIDTDFDKIMKSAERVFERDGVWKWWNQFDNNPDIPLGFIVSDSKENFEKKIKTYVEFAKTQTNRGVTTLRDALITAIKTNSPIKTTSFNSDKDIGPNHLLREYLNDDWEVIADIPESVAMSIIILKNKRNGMVNLISLSSNQFYANSKISGKTYGDLEYYKTLLFLNKFKSDLLPTGFDKLGQIIVYNPVSNQYYHRNLTSKLEEFIGRIHEVGLANILRINLDNLSGAEDFALYVLDSQFRYYSGSEKDKINEVASLFGESSIANADLNILIEAQKRFYEKFPSYKNRTMNTELNFEDPKEFLLALLQMAIVTKEQQALTGDFKDMSKYSLGFSDFKSLIKALYTEDKEEYDKEGRRIQGLVQGLAFTTPDFVRSNDLRNINSIISTGNAKIGELMSAESELIHKATEKFYKKINFSGASRNWIGETQSKYRNMWREQNGKVSDMWTTKNPYKNDLQNVLEDSEREYLKEILFRINVYKLGISKKESEKINPSNLESLLSNQKIAKSIESEEYFKMPLVRREEITKYSGGLWNFWKNKVNMFLDFVAMRELTKEDVTIAQQKEIGFYEMYDAYGMQSDDYKANSLSKYGTEYFELNLDTIAHRVAFSKIRKNIFDNRLPVINAYIWWIKLLGGKQNIDVSKQLEYISNQLKLGVYDESIITDEFKDVATGVALAKRVSTAAMLAFRPALMIKELTIGLMKGVSVAATKIYGEDPFTVSDLTSAYKKLMTIDNKFASEHNLIDKLNHFYTFANMDVNTMAKKVQTDRRGVVRGLGRWMYACNTIPDYYNRLSLFLAKMIHDGSYDAHTFEDGEMKYDPRKDGRFSYYLANRETVKDSNGNYIPKKGDEKYNKQRQHYLLVMSQLNAESIEDNIKFIESDILPKGYSIKERNSFKSFTDLCYGYYDKVAQSQLSNTAFGMAWLQFMQFWPGKMKMWFGKPMDASSSPIGEFKQKTRKDENNNVQLVWRKAVYSEDNPEVIERFVEVTENTGDPAMEWTGTPQEGLFYAVAGTVQDILKMNWKEAFTDEEHQLRRNRTMYALADGVLFLLLMGLIKAMWDGIIAENGTEGLDGTAVQFMSEVTNKVLRESNVYQNTLGAINLEPMFYSYGKRVVQGLSSAIEGNSTMKNMLSNNVGALEFIE